MPYTDYSKRRGSSRPSSFRSNNNSSRGAKRGPKKENIQTSRFIKAAIPVQIDAFTPEHAFADFDLHELIQRNVIAKGYTAPTPIQDQAIPLGLTGQDVIGIANTGTGKTVAFALPVLHKLMTNPGSRVLIMAPTRELAQQIEDECRTFAKGSGLAGALLIGGTAMGPQLRDLRANPQIVIGTPGRIKDHMERGSLKLGDVDLVVLDERRPDARHGLHRRHPRNSEQLCSGSPVILLFGDARQPCQGFSRNLHEQPHQHLR